MGGGNFNCSLDKIKDYIKQNIFTGTSSQFLKADGSIDFNSYALSSALGNYLPLTGGTLTGHLTLTSGIDSKIVLNNTDADDKYQFISFQQNGIRYGYLGTHGDNTLKWNNNKIWHESNDGSGSGLDADMLDGTHKADKGYNNGITQSWKRGKFSNLDDYYGNGNVVTFDPMPSSETSDAQGITHSANTTLLSLGDANMRNTQLVFPYNKDEILYRRIIANVDGTLKYCNWKQFAFVDSNVDSANKLTTKQLTNEDLNDIKDIDFSIYYGLYNNTCANRPFNDSFCLLVSSIGYACFIQTIYDKSNNCYRRQFNVIWSEWKKMLTEDDPAISIVSQQLTNEDLNNIKNTGTFRSYFALGTNTCTNTPFNSGVAFQLQVFGESANSNYCTQIIYHLGGNQYKRVMTGGNWSPWKKMLTEDDIAPIISRIETLEQKIG